MLFCLRFSKKFYVFSLIHSLISHLLFWGCSSFIFSPLLIYKRLVLICYGFYILFVIQMEPTQNLICSTSICWKNLSFQTEKIIFHLFFFPSQLQKDMLGKWCRQCGQAVPPCQTQIRDINLNPSSRTYLLRINISFHWQFSCALLLWILNLFM